jgi:hypothetical protein
MADTAAAQAAYEAGQSAIEAGDSIETALKAALDAALAAGATINSIRTSLNQLGIAIVFSS